MSSATSRRCRRSVGLRACRSHGTTPAPAPGAPAVAAARGGVAPSAPARPRLASRARPARPASPPDGRVRRPGGSPRRDRYTHARTGPAGSDVVSVGSEPGSGRSAASAGDRWSPRAPLGSLPLEPRADRPGTPAHGPDARSPRSGRRSSRRRHAPRGAGRPVAAPGSPDRGPRTTLLVAVGPSPSRDSRGLRHAPHPPLALPFPARCGVVWQAGPHGDSRLGRPRRAWRSPARRGVLPRWHALAFLQSAKPRHPDARGRRPG